jgi:MoxR-like ATPase
MEERQVTVEGKTRPLEKPFFIIATQNPMEQFGTFSLPESQLDRFLMRINIGYPNRGAEQKLLKQGEVKSTLFSTEPCLTPGEVLLIQKQIAKVHTSDALLEYVQDLLDFTRNAPHFFAGLSPRAGLAFLRAAKSRAFLQGRDHVLPEDLQKVMFWVVGHRLRSHDDRAELSRDRLENLLMEVPIP